MLYLVVVNCTVPPVPSNTVADAAAEVVYYNQPVTYECDAGYREDGGSTARWCLADRSLNGTDLTCTCKYRLMLLFACC